jgi:protein-disulfide isomerase
VVSDRSATETEQTADVEESAPAKAEPGPAVAQNSAVPPDAVEPEEAATPNDAAIPEFVLPQPVTLPTGAEDVAFALGDPNARVQIIEFTDYQCPFCARYTQETMPALVENLVESGRVFYAIKDLPLDGLHPEARSASVAARCAGEQDAYLPMHDAVFAAQGKWSGTSDRAQAIFADLAAGLDLDVDAFSACVADGRQAENVQANFKDLPLTSIHPQAMLAAEATRCAGAQDTGQEAYLAMHNLLFEKQQAWSGQANAADLFANYAAELGLDSASLTTCLENHDFEAAVQADMQEAMSAGITGTPAFVINGHLVSGALPYEVFEQAVESLIADAAVQPAGN